MTIFSVSENSTWSGEDTRSKSRKNSGILKAIDPTYWMTLLVVAY